MRLRFRSPFNRQDRGIAASLAGCLSSPANCRQIAAKYSRKAEVRYPEEYAMSSVAVQSRVSPELKAQAEAIFTALGLSTSDAPSVCFCNRRLTLAACLFSLRSGAPTQKRWKRRASLKAVAAKFSRRPRGCSLIGGSWAKRERRGKSFSASCKRDRVARPSERLQCYQAAQRKNSTGIPAHDDTPRRQRR